ncbi:MAG TPA: cache domain-containing protein [Ktedonobacteraceae bacterium]|nr:cache domain-containing protein [Ktedonobacteraceae bacterium]
MQGSAPPFFPGKRFSLTVRISALLIAAVILPLLITIISSELILRPTLTNQAITEMESDAQSHEQAIDSLFIAREEDQQALGHFYAIQQFLAGVPGYAGQARKELQLGESLDPNYSTWTLFDTHEHVLLSYPTNPTKRGNYAIPPEIMAELATPNKTVISDVYFNPNLNMAYVDIYTSIPSAHGTVAGIARSTLLLNQIWTMVNNETNAATGSYATIIDGHGVRIAYTNLDTTLTTLPTALFKAVEPLSPQFQQQIMSEDLYGAGDVNDSRYFDSALASRQQTEQAAYQFTPIEQTQAYQAYQVSCQVVPWTYIVLRPVSTITGAASQQDISLLIIAVIVTLLAGLAGLFIGRNTTRPILRSVASLTKSSQALKVFSAREQARAKEQKWIVESAQTGLESVQYFAKATGKAADKLGEIVQKLTQNWERLDPAKQQHYLREIASAANYIKKASFHEERSGRGLSTAIQVTNQVAEQLVSGAVSASEAATQLEEVIAQLRQLVGE